MFKAARIVPPSPSLLSLWLSLSHLLAQRYTKRLRCSSYYALDEIPLFPFHSLRVFRTSSSSTSSSSSFLPLSFFIVSFFFPFTSAFTSSASVACRSGSVGSRDVNRSACYSRCPAPRRAVALREKCVVRGSSLIRLHHYLGIRIITMSACVGKRQYSRVASA